MSLLIILCLLFLEIQEANACAGVTIGYDATGPKQADADLKGFGVIATDNKYKFECCGTVKKWQTKVAAPGEVAFQVWRPTDKKSEYKLMGQNVVKFDKEGDVSVNIPVNQRISVSPGDFVGWHSKGEGVITYDNGGSNNNFFLDNMPDTHVGALVDWTNARRVNRKSYSIHATGEKNSKPEVKNLPNKIIIPKDHPFGSDIFTAEVTDNDKLDINEIKVELVGSSEYFAVEEGTTKILLMKQPPAIQHVLRVVVSDHCEQTDPLELTIVVTDVADPGSGAGKTNAPGRPAAAQPRGSEENVWDWLSYVIVAMAIVIAAVALLIVFHKKGWLHKVHRTHPPRKDMKDVEKANGNKVDDINKPEPKKDNINKKDGVSNQDAKPNDQKLKDTQDGVKASETKDIKQDASKTKYVKSK